MEVGPKQPERAKLYWCRRPFDYDGRPRYRGQIIKLVGLRNDEKLVRLGYAAPHPVGTDVWECGQCGEKFIDKGSRDGHVKAQHLRANEPLRVGMSGPAPIDVEGEAEERHLEAIAPLHLDRTAASLA
ncbi:MAG: hypothetical protein PHE55_05145 [Methylococcaceae bacterium]|nr:hypothetical protein [Methylococcaceae bacterium]